MDVLKQLPALYYYYIGFTLIFTRVMALLATFVLFKREYVSPKIAITLGFFISLYVFGIYGAQMAASSELSLPMLINVCQQGLIGVINGIILNFIFEVFLIVGQFLSIQLGLSMASLFDNRFGYVTPLSEFYIIMALLVFLLMNGHLAIIKIIIDSFQVFPILESYSLAGLFKKALEFSNLIFSSVALLSITVTTVIMISNITLAMITKFAPQFNLFSLGVNLQFVLGLLVIFLCFHFMINSTQSVIKLFVNHLLAFYTR